MQDLSCGVESRPYLTVWLHNFSFNRDHRFANSALEVSSSDFMMGQFNFVYSKADPFVKRLGLKYEYHLSVFITKLHSLSIKTFSDASTMCCEVNQLYTCAKVLKSQLFKANLLQHCLVDVLCQLCSFIESGNYNLEFFSGFE